MMRRFLFTTLYCFLGCISVFASPMDSVKVTKQKGGLYIIHKVDKGDGFIGLARRYNTTVDDIKIANPKLKQLKHGQKINIPFIETTLKNDKTNADSSKINVDESHANADSKESNLSKIHVVQTGETIARIATKYKVSAQQVIKWNAIKNNKIEVGQQLVVSGNVSIKSFEKWNGANTLSAKTDSVKNTLSTTINLIEESGICAGSPVNTHSTLPVGTFIICVNPDTGKQVLVQIEQSGMLSPGFLIGLKEDILSKLELSGANKRIIIKYNQP